MTIFTASNTTGSNNSPITARRYFWRMMRAHPGLSIVVFLFNTLDMTLPLVFGLILREFFNVLSGEAASNWNVWGLIGLYLLTRIGVQLSELGAAGSSAWHFYRIEFLNKRNVFRGIIEAMGFTTPLNSGEIVDRFAEDTDAIAEPVFIATYGSGFLLSTAITLWILWRVNVPLTIIAFLPALFSVLLMNLMGKRIERFHRLAREATERVSGLLTQLLTGVQAVQVAGAEEGAVNRFDQLSGARRIAVTRDTVFTSLVRSVTETTTLLTTGLVLILAAGMLQRGTITLGDLALFLSYVSLSGGQVAEVVGWIERLLRNMRQAEVSFGRVGELMPEAEHEKLLAVGNPQLEREWPTYTATPVQSTTATPAAEPLRELIVSGLTYHHDNAARGIEDVSLTVRRGEFVVVTGRIGAGKSVLIEALIGLRPKAAGEILWNGVPVSNPAEFFIPPHCAYTPQTPRLFSDTVRANILMGLAEDERTGGREDERTGGQEDERMGRLEAAIYAAVLEDDIAQLENGLDTLVGPRGVKLSGGQMQRTAAARMFVRQPELLVFDDLSSALDVETEQLLWSRLFERADPPACLVVSHRRAALQWADHIVVLKDSKVEDEGQLDELLARCAEMRQLWAEEELRR